MSSSDPYLKLQIVSNQNPREIYNGVSEVKKETLNPEFYHHETCQNLNLQNDWCFEVEVWDENTNRSIGKTTIDLEQRRWSNKYSLFMLELRQRKDIAEEKIREINAAPGENTEKRSKVLRYWQSHKDKMTEAI